MQFRISVHNVNSFWQKELGKITQIKKDIINIANLIDKEINLSQIVTKKFTIKNIEKYKLEISISLSDDNEIARLNNDYRNKNKPTNILSFANYNLLSQSKEELDFYQITCKIILLGDLIISYDRIKDEAIEQNKSFYDHYCHMIIHGILHLIGYDHEKDSDAQIMEDLEIKLLKKLEIDNPY